MAEDAQAPAHEPFILLMRHARHAGGTLTASGETGITGVAERFAEWLDATYRRHPVVELDLWEMDAAEVHATADLLVEATRRSLSSLSGSDTELSHPALSVNWRSRKDGHRWRASLGLPGVDDQRDIGPYGPDEEVLGSTFTVWSTKVRDVATQRPVGLPLLVGNDPYVSRVAGTLARADIGIDHGELVALRGHRRPFARARSRWTWSLSWTLSSATREESAQQTAEVTAKLKSKMEAATALGAVIVAVSTFVLTDALRTTGSAWDWAALGVLGASAVLYFAALFHFDTLQMPARYWGSPRIELNRCRQWWHRAAASRAPRRPPSSTPRILHWWMVRVWRQVFMTATLLLGVGVLLLCLGAAFAPDTDAPARPTSALMLGAAMLGLLAAGTWGWLQRPRLGTSD